MNEVLKKVQAAVQQVIWESPFYGCLMQEINFKVTKDIPTAALSYNKKSENFTIELNPEYFGEQPAEMRPNIMLHEILHFTHTHIPRFGEMQVAEENRPQLLIAADAAINQFIPKLPEGAITLDWLNKTFNLKLQPNRSMEEYYQELKDLHEQQKNGKKKGKNGEMLSDITTQDEHPWENMSAEEQQEMLKEMQKVIKRTVEKAETYGPSTVPDNIKDLLERIDVQIKKLDYKRILRDTIKKSLSVSDRAYTWSRPSKRFGKFCPGTKTDELPSLQVFGDTSGSISHIELNEFMQVISGFLKVGGRKCKLGLWHTALYYFKNYKLNGRLKEDDIRAGGTDVTPVLLHIQKHKPELAVILTDGEFYEGFKGKIDTDVLWVISKNGNVNHPYSKKIGKTLKMS